MLRAEDLVFRVPSKVLLHPVSLSFGSSCFHVIMGANGAGKSTLLKLLAGEQKPSEGKVLFFDKELSGYSKKDLAIKRAVLSQHYTITFPINAEDIVMMGRYPYFSNTPTQVDHSICNEVMEVMEVNEFRERDYNTLSGGEAQKVQMSRVLAQIWEAGEGNEKILFLDEPVSHLDVKYQYQLLRIAKDLCNRHITVIAILHDINLAISFADRILFMKQGRMVYDKSNLADISTGIISDVFGVSSKIIHPENHKPVVIF